MAILTSGPATATIIYATSADLQNWTGQTPPTNADQLLRAASIQVREATVTAYYAADTNTGLPTDPDVLQAFQDATCAQAAALNAAKIDPAAGGVQTAAVVSEKLIGTARLNYADGEQAAAAREQLLTSLCPEAARILQQARVTTTAVWVVG